MIKHTLTSFQACSESYEKIGSLKEPPAEFREVIERTPLVAEPLVLIRQRYEEDTVGEVPERAFYSLLGSCMAEAQKLQTIYESVAESSVEGSARDAYLSALRSMEKPERVEMIMKTLVYYLRAVAANRLFEMNMYERAAPLQEAMDFLSSLDSCIADSDLQKSENDGSVAMPQGSEQVPACFS